MTEFPTDEFTWFLRRRGDEHNFSDEYIIEHVPTKRRLTIIRRRALRHGELEILDRDLMKRLSNELRIAGIQPQPVPPTGHGIKKAGKPRWLGEEKHEASSDSR